MNWKRIGSFLQNYIIPLVTVGTASMVAWLNISISQVDQELKAQIAAVDIAIKEARDDREKLNAEREFNFRIYELVQNSLEENNEKKQEVAKQFVLVMVDGELRKRLLGVLEAGGTPTIRRETAMVIEEEREFDMEQQAVALREPRSATPTFNWEDWDYDIFWCSSSGSQAKEQASYIVESLQSEGAAGRLRVRELPTSVNAKTGYKLSGYAIRRNGNEVIQADALKNLSERVLAERGYSVVFDQQTSFQKTGWYISAFICP